VEAVSRQRYKDCKGGSNTDCFHWVHAFNLGNSRAEIQEREGARQDPLLLLLFQDSRKERRRVRRRRRESS